MQRKELAEQLHCPLAVILTNTNKSGAQFATSQIQLFYTDTPPKPQGFTDILASYETSFILCHVPGERKMGIFMLRQYTDNSAAK